MILAALSLALLVTILCFPTYSTQQFCNLLPTIHTEGFALHDFWKPGEHSLWQCDNLGILLHIIGAKIHMIWMFEMSTLKCALRQKFVWYFSMHSMEKISPPSLWKRSMGNTRSRTTHNLSCSALAIPSPLNNIYTHGNDPLSPMVCWARPAHVRPSDSDLPMSFML